MSFTPTDGLMMATRSGALDPSVVTYLMREHAMTAADVDRLLNLESGLLGVSGISGDIRVLLASDAPEAALAVDLFVHRIVVEAGAMIAAVGGLDGLVFTGGIGTHQPIIRQRVCDALAWLGIDCDGARNAAGRDAVRQRSRACRAVEYSDRRGVHHCAPHCSNSPGTCAVKTNTLTADLLHRIDQYWRAANYLSVGQIYLCDNPLLKRPLSLADVKRMLLGHWGTTPGQNFIYVHLNRVIKKYDLDMIYVSGPGHGGPAVVANTYLEGTYSEIYPDISRDEAGLQKLFLQFSFPGGIPSHASPECPGSIHEGGELGYSLSHSFGAVFDNPDLIVACVVGDGEAETGPLATAWHSNKFLNPVTDGAVLPILHLNGYKIANPTVLARITREELEQLLRGYGWTPYFVEGHEPELMHEAMAATLDTVVEQIKQIQSDARVDRRSRTTALAHDRAEFAEGLDGPEGRRWSADRRYVPRTSGSAVGPSHPSRPSRAVARRGSRVTGRRNSSMRKAASGPNWRSWRRRATGAWARIHTPTAACCCATCGCRTTASTRRAVSVPGQRGIGDTRVLGQFLRDVTKLNDEQRNFRVFGPDETLSNGLESLFEVTNRQWNAASEPNDEYLAPAGRVLDSMLSEHQCEGWLEGYLLTGRHGLFNCYEAFIHIVDSMFNQHAKWLKVTRHLPWRRRIASLNYLLASHVWRQDHNGFTHQDPGFIDQVVNKKADVVRVYFPPDANCLLSVMDHCLRSRHYVNVVVAGKHPAPQWLTMDAAVKHCAQGVGIWQWASNDQAVTPDVVMACCGDVPTLETLAAVSILRERLPRAENPRGQRRRPDEAAAAHRASARLERHGFRRAVHQRQAGDLRFPRVPMAHPSVDLPSHQSRQHPRPWLQGRRHDHHAVRHDGAERSRSLPPRDGRHRSRAADGRRRRLSETAAQGQADRAQAIHRQARRGLAGDPRVEVE